MSTTQRHPNRREALIGAGVVGAGALAALLSGCAGSSASAAGTSSDVSTDLVGAWLDEVSLSDGSTHQAITLYTKDGGIASVPSFPASEYSARFGAWTRTSGKYILTTELFVFDSSRQASGILRIRALATVDQTGDHMTGQATLDFQPAGRSNFAAPSSASFSSSRIKAVL